MLTIFDNRTYQLFNQGQETRAVERLNLWLTILLFGSLGAITWAIRGTSGWGGVDGTVVPGLTWGLVWYFLCYRRGIDTKGIVFWLGFGVALGGELGYGQYTGWILGNFSVGDGTIPISPWLGYWWFFLCGIGWAAAGGIVLGWVLGKKVGPINWIVRSLWLLLLLAFLFVWPFVDWIGQYIVNCCPGLFFPHANLGLYDGPLGHHLTRTVYTNTQNAAVVLWWIGALIIAALQRDKTTIVTGLVLGLGFGVGFAISAAWCLGYGFAPKYIDWWKMWELGAGFNLGAIYAVVYKWATKNPDIVCSAENPVENPDELIQQKIKNNEWPHTLFLAIAGWLFIFVMSFEYFLYPGIFLGLFYFVSIILTQFQFGTEINSLLVKNRQKQILFIFSIFILLFLLFHGGSDRAGVLLGLYSLEAVDQYSWPTARILLFAPFAFVLFTFAAAKIWRVLRPKTKMEGIETMTSNISIRMIDLIALIGFIGALSIWPAKIGVIYAFFVFLALYAFTRLNSMFDLMERTGGQ